MSFGEDELVHYGVMGMKWGVRKDGKKGSSRGPVKRKLAEAGDKVATKVTKLDKTERKQVKQKKQERRKNAAKRSLLSDEELDKQLDRLQKEKKLRDLTNETVDPGKTAVKSTLSQTGKKVLLAAAGAGAAVAVTYLADKYSPGDGGARNLPQQAATDFRRLMMPKK